MTMSDSAPCSLALLTRCDKVVSISENSGPVEPTVKYPPSSVLGPKLTSYSGAMTKLQDGGEVMVRHASADNMVTTKSPQIWIVPHIVLGITL